MAKFTSRLTAPDTTSKYWYSDNPFYKSGYGLPNCTCYAFGRFYELTGSKPRLSWGNAEDWYGYTADGYKRGQTPKLGAIICWRKGVAGNNADGAGHVAVVEKINADGSIVTSNSAWKGTRFYTQTLAKPYALGSAYTLQGFIYPPVEFEEEKPKEQTPTANQGKWARTINVPVRELYAGTKGSDVKVLQRLLICLGYDLGSYGADGDFGAKTTAAVKAYQKAKGLSADGIVGVNTWKALLA